MFVVFSDWICGHLDLVELFVGHLITHLVPRDVAGSSNHVSAHPTLFSSRSYLTRLDCARSLRFQAS